MIIDFRKLAAFVAVLTLSVGSASADPITGMTYTYDLSTQDVDPGGFMGYYVRPHAFADDDIVDMSDRARITTAGMLTDGNLGSLTKVPFGFPSMVIFANGTYAGFRGEPGIGHAPKPKIDIDLGGTYNLSSFTLRYLVEDATSIYSPRPVPDEPGDPMFDALTVYGSTDGTNFTSLAFSNDFRPLYGLDGDIGSGAEEIRVATLDLTGSTASHLSIDIRTPWAFIFMSEIVVDGSAAVGLPGDYNDDDKVDAADYVAWRKNGTNGQQGYNDWQVNFGAMAPGGGAGMGSTVPEPSAFWLLLSSGLLLAIRARG